MKIIIENKRLNEGPGAGYQFDDFDDEFNAYYDGYTEEDNDPNSAYNRLKANARESFYVGFWETDVEEFYRFLEEHPELKIYKYKDGKYYMASGPDSAHGHAIDGSGVRALKSDSRFKDKFTEVNEGYELLDGTKVEVYSDYEEAKDRAEELGLVEAEYGDVYGSDLSYCYWNESGNRNDDEQVIAYYKFENGRPRPLTSEERDSVARKYEIDSFDNPALEDDMGTYFDDIQPELEESYEDVSLYTAYDRYDCPMETFSSEKEAFDYVDAQKDYDKVFKVTKLVGKREVIIYREDEALVEWTGVYGQFTAIVDKYFPNEKKINSEVQALYNQHRGDPAWDEAWRKWLDSDIDTNSSIEESSQTNMSPEAKELYNYIKNVYKDGIEITKDCAAPLIAMRKRVKKAMQSYCDEYCTPGTSFKDVFTEDDFQAVARKLTSELNESLADEINKKSKEGVHSGSVQEMSNIIFDTLFGNSQNPQFDFNQVENQEVGNNQIVFDYAGHEYKITVEKSDGNFNESIKRPLTEDFYDEEERIQALATYLGIDTSEISNPYDNVFETSNGEGYYVVTSAEATALAEEDIKSIFDDLGIEAFTPDFKEWIIENALQEEWFRDAVEELYLSYVDDLEYEDDDIYGTRLVQELVDVGLLSDDDFVQGKDGEPDYSQLVDDVNLDDLKSEYAERLASDVDDPVEHCANTIGWEWVGTAAKEHDLYDLDAIVEACIEADGVAHFIARYDGEELELGNGLYAYRRD